MREGEGHIDCSLALTYLSGDGTEAENRAFELHLLHCSDCRKEVEEWKTVLEVLSIDMERMEPPKDLKDQVFEAISSYDREQGKLTRGDRVFRAKRWFRYGIASVVIGLAAAGSLWNYQIYHEYGDAPIPIEEALSVSAAQIEQLIPLKPVAGDSYAYGVACIVDNGHNKQFIVYVFGAEETAGTEAYQVWLLHNGERKSAGTFRVNDQGIGVLAMPIETQTPVFDEIGITIEPDDRGDQPRGTKAFAS